jgi:hypothetical protein
MTTQQEPIVRHLPSRSEILSKTREIRAGWDDKTRKSREVHSAVQFEIALYVCPFATRTLDAIVADDDDD